MRQRHRQTTGLRFYPQPDGTWPDNNAYLRKPQDATTGLDLLGARRYNPATGSFLSLDPLFEPGQPTQMGGYTYAANNPATDADPTGLCGSDNGVSWCAGGGSGPAQSPGGPALNPGPSYTVGNTTVNAPSQPALQKAIIHAEAQIGNGTDIYWVAGQVGLPVTSSNPEVQAAIVAAICQAHPGWCTQQPESLLQQIMQVAAPLLGTLGGEDGEDSAIIGDDDAGMSIEDLAGGADDATGGADVAFGPAPENAWSTFDRVEAKGSPFPGYKGGSSFANDGSQGSEILPLTTPSGESRSVIASGTSTPT